MLRKTSTKENSKKMPGIPRTYELHPSKPKEARSWLRYPVEIRTGYYGVEGFRYFAELGEPDIQHESDLGAELFNDALLKVDITSDDSLLAFVEQFGLPVSPLYEGHQRLAWFRNRRLEPYRAAPSKDGIHRDGSYLYADLIASFNAGRVYNINPTTGIPTKSALAPGVYSETARELEADNQNVRGAVSVLEAAQTIRLLQTATATCTAYQSEYEKESGGDVVAPFEYLENKRFLPPQGALYFLAGDELLSFNERCASDASFAASSARWKECGNDPEADYSIMRIEALWRAAKNALLFLQNTCLVSRAECASLKTDTALDGYFTLSNGTNKIIDFAFRKPDKHQKLESAIAEYGSLTEAIALQYLSVFMSDYPWQECENCGRRFKHSKGTDPQRKPRAVRFCSKSCNVSFFQKKGAAE